jgi:hypothetical protein
MICLIGFRGSKVFPRTNGGISDDAEDTAMTRRTLLKLTASALPMGLLGPQVLAQGRQQPGMQHDE